MRILHLPTPGAAVLHRYMRRFGCNDASIELHCDEPQNNSKPTDRAYATERTCAEQQQMVCVARRRTKGGERFHHNCEAPDRLMWDLLPPLNMTEHWPLAKMRAYAHGRFDVDKAHTAILKSIEWRKSFFAKPIKDVEVILCSKFTIFARSVLSSIDADLVNFHRNFATLQVKKH